MRTLFLTLAILSLVGCATPPRIDPYTARMDQWIGVHSDDLVKQHGPPSSIYNLSDGGKVMQYQSRGAARTTAAWGVATTEREQCDTSFTTDADGLITNWMAKGNNCRGY